MLTWSSSQLGFNVVFFVRLFEREIKIFRVKMNEVEGLELDVGLPCDVKSRQVESRKVSGRASQFSNT